MVINTTSETEVTLRLDRVTYSEAVVYKCFYWYGGDYHVQLDHDAESIMVRLTVPEGKPAPPAFPQALLQRIQNDLVDFKLREIVQQETRTIRELLLAKAFAHYDTEQPLRTPISDPVGFAYDEE